MNEYVTWALAWAAGLVLGAFFFGGLWWSVRKGVSARRPALWFLISSLLRTVLILAGFYFISGSHWERLVAALLGFVIARCIVMRLTAPPAEHHNPPAMESGHAP